MSGDVGKSPVGRFGFPKHASSGRVSPPEKTRENSGGNLRPKLRPKPAFYGIIPGNSSTENTRPVPLVPLEVCTPPEVIYPRNLPGDFPRRIRPPYRRRLLTRAESPPLI